MKEKLISVREVAELVLGSNAGADGHAVTDAEIMTAQSKFIKPVLGPLYDVLGEKRYEGFVRDYIKIPLAMYVKSVAMRSAAVHVGSMGVVRQSGEYMSPADDQALMVGIKSLRSDARTLLREAVRHVEADPDGFPEYDPRRNIWNSVEMVGDVVL